VRSIIVIPTHFADGDSRDVERELIDLVIDSHGDRFTVDSLVSWAKEDPYGFFEACAVWIESVRSLRYHSPRRPGWTDWRRSRVLRRPGAIVEVQWYIVMRARLDKSLETG
jgi:hypothetical protein